MVGQTRVVKDPGSNQDESEDLSLFDALNMAENIPTMIKMGKSIRTNLRDSISHAASDDLKAVLQDQLHAAEKANEVLDEKLTNLKDALQSIHVKHRGLSIDGLGVYLVISSLTTTVRALREAAKVMKPEDYGVPELERAKNKLVFEATACANAYDKFLHGLVMVLRGIVLSEKDATTARIVWRTANNAQKIEMTWDNNEGRWKPPSEVSVEHPSIKALIKDMNGQTRDKGGWKHGTKAWLKIERAGDDYKVSFDVTEPEYEVRSAADVYRVDHHAGPDFPLPNIPDY